MAYPCRIGLKSECDGCGACEEPGAFGLTYARRKPPAFDDDYYNPFYNEEDYLIDERI